MIRCAGTTLAVARRRRRSSPAGKWYSGVRPRCHWEETVPGLSFSGALQALCRIMRPGAAPVKALSWYTICPSTIT